MMAVFTPSTYNTRIFKEFNDTTNNIIINATAGSGKSTMLLKLLECVPPDKNCIFICFNKSVADDLKQKAPAHIQVSTLHSFGCRQMFRHFPGIKIDENKFFTTALRLFKLRWSEEVSEKKYFYCYRVSRLVELMMLTMTLEDDDIEALANEYDILLLGNEIEHALQLYAAVYDDTSRMSYSDMLFQPAIRNIRLPKFDIVFHDENQDSNNCQLALIRKIIKPYTGRLISVGDPSQSIYGFAGANHNSFELLKTMLPNTVMLPLSICYRCPTKVIKLAQEIVPVIEARPGAIEGIVRNDGKIEEMKDGCVVLCRNTKPLVQVFRELIRQGKKANIKGREMGTNLITLINKTKSVTISKVIDKIDIFILELRSKLFKKGCAKPDEHPQLIKLREKRDIIHMLSSEYSTVKLLIKRIEEIFTDDDVKGILLSTIHRAKGGEWDQVFFLNRFLIPSQYAITAEEQRQEQNILFVAITRAKKELIFIDVYT